jgi:MFS family permease
MLDLSLFKQRGFSLAASSAVFNYIGIFCSIFLMPFFLIQAKGYSPAQAGLILTAQSLVMAVVAPISGTLSDRIGTASPSGDWMAILTAGLFLLSRLGCPIGYPIHDAVSGCGWFWDRDIYLTQ